MVVVGIYADGVVDAKPTGSIGYRDFGSGDTVTGGELGSTLPVASVTQSGVSGLGAVIGRLQVVAPTTDTRAGIND